MYRAMIHLLITLWKGVEKERVGKSLGMWYVKW